MKPNSKLHNEMRFIVYFNTHSEYSVVCKNPFLFFIVTEVQFLNDFPYQAKYYFFLRIYGYLKLPLSRIKTKKLQFS